jgi:hypothetical protein
MSATRIIAQAVPSLLAAFPGWKLPTLLHLRFTVGATGAPTVQSSVSAAGDPATTPGVSVTRQSAGVYNMTFPPCRQVAWGSLTSVAKSVSAAGQTFATADPRVPMLDRNTTNTNATTGKARIVFANGTAVNTELGDGQEVALSFWADLG